MRLYADHPDRRAAQILADVLAIAACAAAVVTGLAAHDSIQRLSQPAGNLESSGSSLASGLGDAADTLENIPIVGDSVADALNRAADAAARLRDAGASAGDSVQTAAVAVGWMIPVVAVVLAVAVWLRPRVLWVRDADDARVALRLADGEELLAARALATVRLPRLAEYGPQLPQRWKAGDDAATQALARAELDRLGLDYRPG